MFKYGLLTVDQIWCIVYMILKKEIVVSNEENGKYDVALFFALKEEHDYYTKGIENIIEDKVKSVYVSKWVSNKLSYVSTYMERMGNIDSKSYVKDFARAVDAKIYVNIGLSGSMSDDIKIGDIVVADEIELYQYTPKIVDKKYKMEVVEKILPSTRSVRASYGACEYYRHYNRQDPFAYDIIRSNWTECISNFRISDDVVDLSKYISIDPSIKVGKVACGHNVAASDELKKYLKNNIERKYCCIDMEGFGFIEAISELEHRKTSDVVVIKGVSDPANIEKDAADKLSGNKFRECVVRSCKIVAESYISSVNKAEVVDDNTLDEFHNLILQKYISFPYHKVDVDDIEIKENYSRYFDAISEVSFRRNQKCFIDHVLDIIISQDNVLPVLVTGSSGSGKSSLLSLLYIYSKAMFHKNEIDALPVYINLHHYDSVVYEGSAPIVSQVIENFKNDINILLEIIKNNTNVNLILYLDGFDDHAKFDDAIFEFLLRALRNIESKKIIGIHPEKRKNRSLNTLLDIDKDYEHIELNDVYLPDKRLDVMVKCYLKAIRGYSENIQNEFVNKISACNLDKLDLFTLHIMHNFRPSELNISTIDLADCIEMYIMDRLHKIYKSNYDEKYIKASAIAFKWKILKEDIDVKDIEDSALWSLIHRHPDITNFFVADYIVRNVMNVEALGGLDNISFVYQCDINRFCKILFNRKVFSNPSQIVAILKHVLENGNCYLKSDVVYLAGRLQKDTQNNVIEEVVQILRDEKDNLIVVVNKLQRIYENSLISRRNIDENLINFRKNLLFLRTLFISLAYLRVPDAQENYILRLIQNKYWDNCNRGFHLEYYKDLSYINTSPLTHLDTLGPFNNTFRELSGRIKDKEDNPLYLIEIYTLASLAQHRHFSGNLDNATRLKCIDVYDYVLRRGKLPKLVSEYVSMVKDHLSKEKFNLWDEINTINSLHKVNRSGWNERNIINPESVAEHVFSAKELARILLPDKLPIRGYNKNIVLSLINIHDTPEVVIGDIIRGRKTHKHRKKEREYMSYLSSLSTYAPVSSLRSSSQDFNQFANRSTYNALLASDFDKLQAFIKLYEYVKNGDLIDEIDINEFVKDMRESINTRFVRDLFFSYEKYLDGECQWPGYMTNPFEIFSE